jgi:hypothetical protein
MCLLYGKLSTIFLGSLLFFGLFGCAGDKQSIQEVSNNNSYNELLFREDLKVLVPLTFELEQRCSKSEESACKQVESIVNLIGKFASLESSNSDSVLTSTEKRIIVYEELLSVIEYREKQI